MRMFQSNNYILLAAPPRVRNGHKAFIPPVFECLHGHIQFISIKHGVMGSTPDYEYCDTAIRVLPSPELRLFFFFDVKLFNSSSRCKKMCNDLRLRVMIIYIT